MKKVIPGQTTKIISMKKIKRIPKNESKPKPNDIDESLVRLNISIFRQVAKLRPDLVREEYRKLCSQNA
jgi:hypothetical protein